MPHLSCCCLPLAAAPRPAEEPTLGGCWGGCWGSCRQRERRRVGRSRWRAFAAYLRGSSPSSAPPATWGRKAAEAALGATGPPARLPMASHRAALAAEGRGGRLHVSPQQLQGHTPVTWSPPWPLKPKPRGPSRIRCPMHCPHDRARSSQPASWTAKTAAGQCSVSCLTAAHAASKRAAAAAVGLAPLRLQLQRPAARAPRKSRLKVSHAHTCRLQESRRPETASLGSSSKQGSCRQRPPLLDGRRPDMKMLPRSLRRLSTTCGRRRVQRQSQLRAYPCCFRRMRQPAAYVPCPGAECQGR